MDDQSILDSVKKVLGLDPSYTPFDTDIIMHINSTFFVLQQLGVGPDQGLAIQDNTVTWGDFFGTTSPNLNAVKSYMYLKVKTLFDPSDNRFFIQSVTAQIAEYEWRLHIAADDTSLAPTAEWWDLTGGLDFPSNAKIGDLGYDSETNVVWRNVA